MRVGAATSSGGVFGLLGTLCFFIAFGTDYWLVASDDCGPYTWPTKRTLSEDANGTETQLVESVSSPPPSLALLHEGFFWRCGFQVEPTAHATLATIFTNQPESKVCIHGYLFPLPVALGPVPHPSYDATAGKHEQPRHVFTVTMSNCNCSGPFCFALAVFRGFWTVLVVLGLVAALTGGFLLVCGVPFASHRLLTLGGAFLLAAACLFLLTLLLFVLWMELMDVERYVLQERGEACPRARVSALYGLSFMAAAAGVPLELVSGMVFMLAGRALRGSK
ncbi:transmembrane protein 182-like isoform X1 [Pseudoliparis swirei]|uniref:transmembrane protein 182-like isoform X1 n=1 Tax=Pseudoliparis swirei TaxID=2059687 RepID=UPI0024BE978B|nr:transmembrane protein 182-like isoform X1 [Pseudoliparis swirei]